MRRAQELGWSSIAYVVIFVVGALLLLTFIFRYVPELQGAFSDTICKMNAWMRASTIGSPLMQSLFGVAGFFTGGFSTFTMSSINIPLACNPGPPIDVEKPVGLEDLLLKIGTESARCWDNMGAGFWDPLVLYTQGQFFKCYEEVIEFSCTEEDALGLVYDETALEGITLPSSETPLTRSFMRYFYSTRQVGLASFNRTFANTLPEGFPYYRVPSKDEIYCDGETHTYFIGVYFVDSWHSTLEGASFIPLPCTTIEMSQVGGDMIVLCTQDLTGQEVIV